MVITVSIIILSFMTFLLLLPGTVAVAVDSGREAVVLPTPQNLNMTNISSENNTIPAHQPDLILTDGQIELRETLLPAPKGDLAVGPRRIDLVFPAALVLIVGAMTAGVWYILKRKPDEDTEGIPGEDSEGPAGEATEERPGGETEGKLDPDLKTGRV